jgi:hypothetical protein
VAQSSGPVSQGTTGERQFSDALWRARFGDEPGVLNDMNGTSYALTAPSSGTNFSIGSGNQQSMATVAGFVHTIPAGSPESISIPDASGGTRTDIIGLRYDPSWGGALGPVRLVRIAGTTATVPAYDADTTGIEELPLWSVTRAVGQAASAATINRMFPRLAPMLDLPTGAPLPLNSPLGTRVFQGANSWRRALDNSNNPVWVSLTSTSTALTENDGTTSANTNSTGYITVTHGLGTTPGSVFIQNRIAASFAHNFVVTAVTATTFTVRVYYNNAPTASSAQQFYWIVKA